MNNNIHSIIVWTKNKDNFISILQSIDEYETHNDVNINWNEDFLQINQNRLLNIFCNVIYDNADLSKTPFIFNIKTKNTTKSRLIRVKGRFQKVNSFLEKIIINSKNSILFTSNYKEHLEFNYLLFGNTLENEIIFRKDFSLTTDILIGQNQWESIEQLTLSLNKTCNWLIIRNYETIIDNVGFGPNDDIDLLCENQKKLVAILNANKRIGGRCSYEVIVDNQIIPLDIRFVGDKYFDPIWERDMLSRKKFVKNIPVLSDLDYFYSLIYHIKLQKFFIKEIYIERLELLSKNLSIETPPNFIKDDEYCSLLINGFLNEKNYYYTYTDDARRNEIFLQKINRKEVYDLLFNWRVLARSLIKVLLIKVKKKFNLNDFVKKGI